MRTLSFSIALLFLFLPLLGAGQQRDTLLRENPLPPKSQGFFASRFYQAISVGVPLVATGLVVKGQDDHFRNLRNDYMPYFNRHVDDYLQYAPAAVMLGMKVAGVKGRSSWGRMLVSDAFSVVLMSSTVNIIKQSSGVSRPDGSNQHSFPSGHTATAFMTATMLTHEYGRISPWIGIGAYSVASVTGLMRMANNKHWLSDVLSGAGIGILATELGYYCADLIFKERGISPHEDNRVLSMSDKPSFFGLYLGVNIPLSSYDIDEERVFKSSSGSTVGVEGAWFFNPYIGVGGRMAISNTYIIVNGERAEDNTLDMFTFCAGGYFSYPITSRWLAGSKLLAGYLHYPELKLTDQRVSSNSGCFFGSGLYLTYRAKLNYGLRFFLDYNLTPSHSIRSAEWMHTLTGGLSLVVML